MSAETTLGYAESIELPDRCFKCPILLEIAKDYERYAGMADGIIQTLMDGNEREALTAAMLNAGYDPEHIDEYLSENADRLRSSGMGMVEMADTRRELLQAIGQSTVELCGGALTMRAKKSGSEVTVTVCMSGAIAEIVSQATHEAVTITRRPIEDPE